MQTRKLHPDVQFILECRNPRFREQAAELLARAYQVAAEAHKHQWRKSGDPYIKHPVEVARILSELGFDSHTLAAGLLHDAVEDTPYNFERLKQDFPPPVAGLVDGVTKISSLNFRTTKEQQIANLRKMMLSMTRDIRVIIIKLCDRLHNLRTLQFLPGHKRASIARETLDIYSPLAERLGMERIKIELEDLAMRHLYPADFAEIDRYFREHRIERDRLVRQASEILTGKLRDVGIEARVTGRSKHYYSIFKKMKKRNATIQEVYDLIALRIICKTTQNCYAAVGLVHTLWPFIPEKFKDYISMPKPNGYQSIHTSVRGLENHVIEIQIRTEEMHQVNEDGIAAHWKYKEGLSNNDKLLEEKLTWLRQMISWLTEIEDPEELLGTLKEGETMGTIFCFTPRGDVIELPKGSTPLDFAFHIHSQIGLTCTGAKVNNRLAPLKSKLNNGDLVEVITSPGGHPSRDWLGFVKSGKARTKIRHWLKTQNYAQNVQRGRELIFKALKNRGSDWSWAEVEEKLNQHAQSMSLAHAEELMMEVGFGSYTPTEIAERLIPRKAAKTKTRKTRKVSSSGVIVKDIPGAQVRFAGCCSPVPGDPITGYVTIGRGVSVHKTNCRSLEALIKSRGEERRLLHVSWDTEQLPRLIASLRVRAFDRTGLLKDITSCFEENAVSIFKTNTLTGKDNIASMRFQAEVQSRKQVDKLVQSIQRVSDVIDVGELSIRSLA